MAHFAVISSRELFNPLNNPGQVISAGFGIFLAAVLEGNVEKAQAVFREAARGEHNYQKFLQGIRKCTTCKDVEDRIRHLLLWRNPSDKMSPKMEEAIHNLALSLCREQSEKIRQEIETQLQQIKALSQIAQDDTPNPECA